MLGFYWVLKMKTNIQNTCDRFYSLYGAVQCSKAEFGKSESD